MTESIHPLVLVLGSLALAIIPFAVALGTSYVKVSIVFSLLRNAFGAQGVPSGLVVAALSFAVSLCVMTPHLEKIIDSTSIDDFETFWADPKLRNLSFLQGSLAPWIAFLRTHSGERELAVLSELVTEEVASEEVRLRVLLPAFLLSELKEAFAMGFALLLPFLVIDMIVANILVGMGMMMVSPIVFSLPLKLLLFVSTDGWILVVRGLIQSYGV